MIRSGFRRSLSTLLSGSVNIALMVLAVFLGVGMSLIVPINPASADSGGGVAGRIISGNFFGVQNSNTVTDAYVPINKWINSSYVRSADGYNGVELGWKESPDNSRYPIAVRMLDGQYSEQVLSPAMNVGTNHTFKIVSRVIPGEFEWDYYIDGVKYLSWVHYAGSFSEVWAAQERSTGSRGSSHFWALKYADPNLTFYSWYTMNLAYDTDDIYIACKVSNTELWVKESCP